MRIPRPVVGFVDKAAKWSHLQSQKLWFKFVAPVATAVPPAFVTSFYANQAVKAAVWEWTPGVAAFLTNYVVFVVVASAGYAPVLLSLSTWIVRRAAGREVQGKTLMRLAKALDRVVGKKESRFARQVEGLAHITRESAFCEITQPLIQIAQLAQGICEFFNAEKGADEDKLIIVTIAACSGGELERFVAHFPDDEPVRSAPGRLNNPASAICTCARERELVIVEDIAAELKKPYGDRRYVDAGSGGSNTGCLLCYPITYGDDVPLVISIYCDAPRHFKNSEIWLYKFALDRFVLRIRLEYSLSLMKEALCG